MSKLISGKEALIALANSEEVEVKFNSTDGWNKINQKDAYSFEIFLNPIRTEFRLKPRTITINGIELAPCYAVGIDHTKNEVSIQFHNNKDAVKLNNLLLNIYGFRNA